MFKKFHVYCLILGIIFLNSCTTVEITSMTSKTVSLSVPAESIKLVGHFKESVSYYFTFGGLVNLNSPDFESFFDEQILKYNGDGICNLRIKDQYGINDIVLTTAVYLGGYLIGSVASSNSNSYSNSKSTSGYGGLGGLIAEFLLSSRTVYIEGDVYKK